MVTSGRRMTARRSRKGWLEPTLENSTEERNYWTQLYHTAMRFISCHMRITLYYNVIRIYRVIIIYNHTINIQLGKAVSMHCITHRSHNPLSCPKPNDAERQHPLHNRTFPQPSALPPWHRAAVLHN